MKKGFTLVELLVAIGIIAILFAVVLVAINPAKRFAEANNSRRLSDVKNILESVVTYSADKRGEIPADIPGDLTCIGTGLSTHGNGGRAINPNNPSDANNLSALWKMDGNANDSAAGTANNGSAIGGYSWASGKFGQALQLDGSSGYAEVPDQSDLNQGGNFTLMTWVKPSDLSREQTIITKGSVADSNYFIRLVAE